MRNTNRQPTLKRTYYRSFLLMVVIPLVLVFVCAEVVVSYIIRNSAIETIDALQENIATALSGDVRNNALQLSHFVYANDGEFIQMAVQVHQSGGGDWYVRIKLCSGPSARPWSHPRIFWWGPFTWTGQARYI